MFIVTRVGVEFDLLSVGKERLNWIFRLVVWWVMATFNGGLKGQLVCACLLRMCGKQDVLFFSPFVVFCCLLSPLSATTIALLLDWEYHKPLNVTPSSSGEKQGRELVAAAGSCVVFFHVIRAGWGGWGNELKPANSCLEITKS